MPVPYRKVPRLAQEGCAAFVDVVWLPSASAFYGGLLVVDGRGQPLEFVHNTLRAPSGFLWPAAQIATQGTLHLVHSLFDACRPDPDLLVCLPSLGTPEFCRNYLAPALPMAQVSVAAPGPEADEKDEWRWINDAPASGMRAAVVAQELGRRGFAREPFARLRLHLRELYPSAPWNEVDTEPLRP